MTVIIIMKVETRDCHLIKIQMTVKRLTTHLNQKMKVKMEIGAIVLLSEKG
jgi:hypothetical protein